MKIVEKNNRYNYLKSDGTYLSEEWFDLCSNVFTKGIAIVNKFNKWNYLKEDGTYLSKEWFDSCEYFKNGYGIVQKDNKYNYLKEDGVLLSDKWFYYCYLFKNGYGIIINDDGYYNVINYKGENINKYNNNLNIIQSYKLPFYGVEFPSYILFLLKNKTIKINLIN